MKITVCISDDFLFPLEVSTSTLVSELFMLIGLESGLPDKDFELLRDGKRLILKHQNTIEEVGIKHADLLLAIPIERQKRRIEESTSGSQKLPHLDFGSVRIPSQSNSDPVEYVRKSLLSAPSHQVSLLRERNPELSTVINDPVAFKRVFDAQQANSRQHREQLEQFRSGDPLDPAIQERIAELIRQRNIDMQMESALEYYPETFGQVTMLFIACKVNGIEIKAFVDSGAQSTLMSENCARRCNLDSLIDKRWAGKAYGVGTQTIIGRVHNSLVEIQGTFIPTSFIVLKDQSMDMLIGLDMLKRHQCSIDLKKNVLRIDNGQVEVPFLPESEIPQTVLPNFGHDDENGLTSNGSSNCSASKLSIAQQAKVDQLVSRGISHKRAIDELQSHNWDLDAALASYLQSVMS